MITHRHERGKLNNSSTWQSPEPKRAENFNGSYFELERIGRQFTGRWKRECW